MDSNIFPLPFSMHLVFALIAFAVFMFQFWRLKRPYQIIMALAVPATLLLYISDSKAWFYTIGVIEAVLIVAAIVSAFICRKGRKNPEKEQKA
jgi:hypothetical protein